MKLLSRFIIVILYGMALFPFALYGQDSRIPSNKARSITALEPETSDEKFVGTFGDDFDEYLYREDRPNGRLTYKVDITRYYSNLMKFDANGFLTNANDLITRGLIPRTVRLTMRVYDVDHNSQYDGNEDGIADPEVDYVYVNGKLVTTGSGEPWTLGSGNETWSTPSINVPIEYFKFPRQPGTKVILPKATNTIQIAIDVPNTTYWAVECDWISLEIENKIRPLVLIRGFGAFSGGSTTGTAQEVWKTFSDFLKADGIPYHIAESIDKCGSIIDNSIRVREEIESAKSIFGVQKVNLVGHSKGGLDSRGYVRYWADAENLVQLGTPNHGSGWTYIPAFCDPAGINLMPNWLANRFNYLNGDINQKLYSPEREKGTKIYQLICKGDTWVSEQRATLPWKALYANNDVKTPINQENDGIYNLDHSEIRQNKTVYRRVINLINSLIQTSSARVINTLENETNLSIPDSLSLLLVSNNQLSVSSSKTIKAYLPIRGIAYFQGFFNNKVNEFNLKSPSGKVYNASSPEYSIDEGIITYAIANADAGTWEMSLKGGSTVSAYSVQVRGLSTKKLIIKTDKAQYLTNEAVIINATLSSKGAPVINAKGMAYFISDIKTDSLELFDDGKHNDIKANDGIYGNKSAGFKTTGYIQLLVKLQQQSESIFKDDLIGVYSKTAEFTNVFKERVIDKNDDNLYDSLQIKVGVKITQAGNFTISGILKDSQNKPIATAYWINISKKTIPVGTYEFPLNFNAETIAKYGQNGPYTLDDVNIIDATNSIVIETRKNAYKTLSYNINTFSQPLISLTDKISETAIDSDKDGDIDFLDIKIQVKILRAGSYTASAELIDSLQNSLNWADKSFFLSAGLNEITLRFNGEEINEKLTNGPYFLTNLYLQSSSASASFFNIFKTKAYLFSNFTGNFITGIVKDRVTGAIVNDATIVLKGAKLATAKSDSKGVFTIAGLPNGNYTVQATKNDYCSSTTVNINKPQNTNTVELILIPKRFKLGTSKSVSLCRGDSIVLKAPAGWQTYRWSTNSTATTINVKTTGNYWVKTTLQGCDATSDTIAVKVFEYPVVTITKSGTTDILTGGSVILSVPVAGNQTYQWLKDGVPVAGATTNSYTATGAGAFSVTVKANGCSATSDKVSVNLILANEAENISKDFNAFPNPVENSLKVMIYEPLKKTAKLSLINSTGKVVNEWKVNQQENILNFTDIPNGVYIIQGEINGKKSSQKIIKQD